MKYEEPIIESIKLEMQDVIRTSFGDEWSGDENGGFTPVGR